MRSSDSSVHRRHRLGEESRTSHFLINDIFKPRDQLSIRLGNTRNAPSLCDGALLDCRMPLLIKPETIVFGIM